MIRLRPVERDDVDPLCRMELPLAQRGFVAPNAVPLAQQPYETGARPFVIDADGERAGFLMAIDCREHDHLEEGDDPEAAYLWRLMVAPGFQRRGVGRAAMEALREWARARGLPRIVTSAVPANESAAALYRACGLRPTGRDVGGEVEFAGPA